MRKFRFVNEDGTLSDEEMMVGTYFTLEDILTTYDDMVEESQEDKMPMVGWDALSKETQENITHIAEQYLEDHQSEGWYDAVRDGIDEALGA